jgi:hypothetical protein
MRFGQKLCLRKCGENFRRSDDLLCNDKAFFPLFLILKNPVLSNFGNLALKGVAPVCVSLSRGCAFCPKRKLYINEKISISALPAFLGKHRSCPS